MREESSDQNGTQTALKDAARQGNVIASGDDTAYIAPECEVSVDSGDVGACKQAGILRASAIGSCVVVTAYDPGSGVGGMAHVMLPGAAGDRAPSRKSRYAEDAIEELMRRMKKLGADPTRSPVCLVGGANVLGDGHGSPGPEIIQSLTEIFAGRGITPVATELGGTLRRSCSLDVGRARVTYTVGDSGPRVLWEAETCPVGRYDKGRG